MKVQRQHSNVDYAKLLGNAVKDLDNPNESRKMSRKMSRNHYADL